MILAQHQERFDDIISISKEETIENIRYFLDKLDIKLYAELDHSRYRVVKKVKRTIITTAGELTFSRRYYVDLETKEYFYFLDQTIDLPKYTRFSNEFRIKVIETAANLNYAATGEFLNSRNPLSKSSVYRIIASTIIEAKITSQFKAKGRIHLQIDEKYITRYIKKGTNKHKSKRRRYTATIFCGVDKSKKKHKLLNRIIISSNTLPDLKRKINYYLINFYKVDDTTTIYLSGDLAPYIRNFVNEISPCKAIYIPDRWHICKDLRKAIGRHVNAQEALKIINQIINSEIEFNPTDEVKKIINLYYEIPGIYERWNLSDYIGCSQECMNSHYYTPRFARCPTRWSAETLNKIALVIESKANNWKILVSSKTRTIKDKKELLIKKFDLSKLGSYYTTYDKALSGPTRKLLHDWTQCEVIF